MIRPAEIKDIDSLVELGVEFGNKSLFIHTLQVSERKIRETMTNAIANISMILLVLEIDGKIEGGIFGMVLTPYFSDEKILQEMALYSRQKMGGIRLIEAFECRAKEIGIKKIIIGSKPMFYDLGKIYKRRKYKLLEEHYIKEN